MTDIKLGTKPEFVGDRDAVHVAIFAMKATEQLRPGSTIFYNKQEGVVDPFLSETVQPGELFWFCLPPGSITGMRHHWKHPAFPEVVRQPTMETTNEPEVPKEVAEIANICGVSVGRLLRDAQSAAYGDYQRDDSESYKEVDNWTPLWDYMKRAGLLTDTEPLVNRCPYTCAC